MKNKKRTKSVFDLMDKLENCAFPTPIIKAENGEKFAGTGMELRDWFAGQALAGYLSNNPLLAYPGKAVETAYEYADAMMEQRKPKQSQP